MHALAPVTRAWLQRIGLEPPAVAGAVRDPTLLRQLHAAHVEQVPFENLDIHLGRPIALDIPALQTKIVDDHRGGFCYELNGLFAHHLRIIGFDVTLLNGHYRRDGGAFGPDFDHLALLVRVDGEPWLCDVGNYQHPLPLDTAPVTQPNGDQFRLVCADDTHDDWILEQLSDEGWQRHFRFDLRAHELSDYVAMCHVQCTSPDSHFTHGRLCTLLTPTGRRTLSEHRMITTTDGTRQEQAIASNTAFEAALLEGFGIDLRGAVWQPPLNQPAATTTGGN